MMRQLDMSHPSPFLANSARKTGRLLSRPPNASFQVSRKLKSIAAVPLPTC
jgi:hypothetical protein